LPLKASQSYARAGGYRCRFTCGDVDSEQFVVAILRSRAIVKCLLRRHAIRNHALAVRRPFGAAAKASVLGDAP